MPVHIICAKSTHLPFAVSKSSAPQTHPMPRARQWSSTLSSAMDPHGPWTLSSGHRLHSATDCSGRPSSFGPVDDANINVSLARASSARADLGQSHTAALCGCSGFRPRRGRRRRASSDGTAQVLRSGHGRWRSLGGAGTLRWSLDLQVSSRYAARGNLVDRRRRDATSYTDLRARHGSPTHSVIYLQQAWLRSHACPRRWVSHDTGQWAANGRG